MSPARDKSSSPPRPRGGEEQTCAPNFILTGADWLCRERTLVLRDLIRRDLHTPIRSPLRRDRWTDRPRASRAIAGSPRRIRPWIRPICDIGHSVSCRSYANFIRPKPTNDRSRPALARRRINDFSAPRIVRHRSIGRGSPSTRRRGIPECAQDSSVPVREAVSEPLTLTDFR